MRDVHDLAALIGYGAEVVHPRLALETVSAIAGEPRARLAAECGRAVDLGQQVGVAMALYTLRSEAADGAFTL